jgi:hypothetical protein
VTPPLPPSLPFSKLQIPTHPKHILITFLLLSMSFFPLLTGFLSFFLSFSFRSPQFFISIPGLYKIRTELLPKTKHKHAKHTYEREHATRTTISSYRLLKTAITFTFALFCWIPYLNYLTPQAKKRYRRENRKHSTARERERERERRGEESTALGGGEAAATAAPNPDHTAKSDEQRAPAPAALEAVSLTL